MATDLYRGFTNPISRETFRCISYDQEAYVMEWIVDPSGYVPFEHLHLNQDEVFHIEQGELRLVMGGKEHIVRAGETLTVPRGQPHIALNNTDTNLVAKVEYHPGFDHYRFFQCFGGLTLDGDLTKDGSINIPKMLYFSKKMKTQCLTRPTSVPAPGFHLALNVFFILGSLLGWKKLYTKYTGES